MENVARLAPLRRGGRWAPWPSAFFCAPPLRRASDAFRPSCACWLRASRDASAFACGWREIPAITRFSAVPLRAEPFESVRRRRRRPAFAASSGNRPKRDGLPRKFTLRHRAARSFHNFLPRPVNDDGVKPSILWKTWRLCENRKPMAPGGCSGLDRRLQKGAGRTRSRRFESRLTGERPGHLAPSARLRVTTQGLGRARETTRDRVRVSPGFGAVSDHARRCGPRTAKADAAVGARRN